MKQTALGIGLFFISFLAIGQKKPWAWSIALTNAHTAQPFGSFGRLLYRDWHPGVEAGMSFSRSAKKNHEWFQTINAGYFYHRWVQHTISLYSELGYRYKLPLHFAAGAKLGIGYLHAIADSKVYKIDAETGIKKKTNLGRPQGMASFSLELQKSISKNNKKIFVEYQQRLQFPFVKNYVPLLPYNMLMVGLTMPVKNHQ
jgi:hypothetical protein